MAALHITGNPRQSTCPPPTKDPALNAKNRNHAISDPMIAYGPANPDLPNVAFWKGKADVWGTSPSVAKTMRCGNCKAFNVSPFILTCIGPMAGRDSYEKSNLGQRSVLGYCEMHEFKCASTRTCSTWVHGGPTRRWAR
jgi:hypothetical protein